jgi:hypothetical protein
MHRRQRDTTSDSLELLLDTICNVFGGIILMAILVVILTQTSASQIPTASAEDLERALEGRKVAFECLRLEARVNDLSDQERLLRETYQAVVSPNTAKLVDARQKFLSAIDEADSRLEALQSELSASRKGITKAALEVAAMDRKTGEKLREVEQLQHRLRNMPKPIKKRIRLPHRRGSARGVPRYYVVKGAKVYPCGTDGIRWSGPPFQREACMITPITIGGRPAARIGPIEDEGFNVQEDKGGAAGFLRSLTRFRPDSYYVVFAVYRDSTSYASFQRLKHIVLNRGYAHAIIAVSVQRDAFTVRPVTYHETE